MSSVTRLSRFSKIAVATAFGGSFYLLRDEIKPYIGLGNVTKPSPLNETQTIVETPKFIENLPKQVPYLLVGGGTASHSAMRSIRGYDPKAKVLIVTSENYSPYMRPALSKELWYSEQDLRQNLNYKWFDGKEKSIFHELDEFYIPIEQLEERETGGVSLLKNIRLTRLDPDNKLAYLETGQTIEYEKCLLAPGGKPKTLPQLDSASNEVRERIIYFRTADDFLKLEKVAQTAKRIVVIGGGFLGSELTCALAKRLPDEKVPTNQVIHQIFPESGNLGKILPQYLSEWLSHKIEKEGANIVPNVEVENVIMGEDNNLKLKLTNGETITAEYIVCTVGLEPDVELAKSSGLEVDERTGGYLVNSELEARSNVWVAGDASCFYDMKLGRRRVEHHDHAVNSGRHAGLNMTGSGKPYTHQPMFWSDIGLEISFEAVGLIDSELRTEAVFTKQGGSTDGPSSEKNDTINDALATTIESSNEGLEKTSKNDKFSSGVVFYLKNDIVVGILLWNIFGRMNIARRILNEQKKYDDFNELAKLFNLYLDD